MKNHFKMKKETKDAKVREFIKQLMQLTEEDARYDRINWSGTTGGYDPTIHYDPKKEV